MKLYWTTDSKFGLRTDWFAHGKISGIAVPRKYHSNALTFIGREQTEMKVLHRGIHLKNKGLGASGATRQTSHRDQCVQEILAGYIFHPVVPKVVARFARTRTAVVNQCSEIVI